MNLYTLAIFITPILLFSIICSKNKILSHELIKNNKFQYIDPLRGMAALAVFMHHIVAIYNFKNHGQWMTLSGLLEGNGKILNNIMVHSGQLGVSFFFMITGFLFFNKLLSSDKIESTTFFASRIRRIVPMYIFTVCMVILVSALLGFNDNIGLNIYTLRAILGWLSFGFIPLDGFTDVISGHLIIAGVFWTLAIEWKFYCLVPMISTFTNKIKTAVIFVVSLLVGNYLFQKCNLTSKVQMVIVFCFAFGFISAIIYNLNHALLNRIIHSRTVTFIVLLFLGSSVYLREDAYNVQTCISAGLTFILISNNNSLFGLLKLNVFKALGTISYSVYIIHGLLNSIILYGFSITNFNLLLFVSETILLIVATMTYLHIEKPFLYKNETIKASMEPGIINVTQRI